MIAVHTTGPLHDNHQNLAKNQNGYRCRSALSYRHDASVVDRP